MAAPFLQPLGPSFRGPPTRPSASSVAKAEGLALIQGHSVSKRSNECASVPVQVQGRALSRPGAGVSAKRSPPAVRKHREDGERDNPVHRENARDALMPLTVPDAAKDPLWQTRCCIGGLLALAALRGCAVSVYTSPGGLAWTAHMLSCAADAIAMLGSLPVFATSAIGSCVHHRCLGSLLTLLLTATVCDVGAVVIFLSTAGGVFRLMGPVATDEGAPAAVAFIGVWECILVSSISLQVALCLSAWQFYRAFREAGIYPPNAANVRVHKEVSALEFLCEAEDVALLSDQCSGCNRTTSSLPGEDMLRQEDFLRPPDTLPYSDFEDHKYDIMASSIHEQSVNRL